MPRISKQQSNGQQQAPQGSILSRAIPVEELEVSYVKMVLYGQNRVGKTTLACQFPKPLLLVSYEPTRSGGASSVRKVPGISFLRLTKEIDALQLASELKGSLPFKSMVLDTVTSMQDMVLKDILGLDELPAQASFRGVSTDQYRERSEKTKELLRLFLDLPCHTVCCAKEKDHQPPKGDDQWTGYGRRKASLGTIGGDLELKVESFFAADLGSATAGWLHDACDYIGRLYLDKERRKVSRTEMIAGKEETEEHEIETGRVVRRLQTMYHPNFAAGFRSCNPASVPPYIEEPTWDKIKKVIDGNK